MITYQDNNILNQDDFRREINSLQGKVEDLPNALVGKESEKLCPVKHSYGEGCYIREIFMPKGTLIVSKIHKITHPYFVMSGKALVVTEDGIQEIKAPYQGLTKAGTKRGLYIQEDMVWITVHVTNETDVDKIEEEIIAKDFNECDQYLINKLNDTLKELS